MIRRRSLARWVAALVVAALVGQALVHLVWMRSLATHVRAELEGVRVEFLERHGYMDRCERDPRGWAGSADSPSVARGVWAVDAEGRPYDPAAPRLDLPPEALGVPGVHLIGALPPLPALYVRGEGDRCRRLVLEPLMGTLPASLLWPRLGGDLLFAAIVTLALAVPLVRRIRRLARETHAVVAKGFEGEVTTGRDELGEAADAFNAAAEAARARLASLEAREKALRETLADLAHDVRTPLASLKLGLGSAHDDTGSLRAEVEHLDGLFTNLSRLLELESATLTLAEGPVDLAAVVDRVAVRFAIVAEDRGLTLDVGSAVDEAPMTGDAVALEQAVGNLVHNALKYAESQVGLVLRRADDGWRVQVLDDGPGVDEAELGQLTERRVRGEVRTDRGRPGQGLGLAIAKAIVARHGGELTLARRADGGTFAELQLPRHGG